MRMQSDRFAREIVRFLKSLCAARSRQLNAKPLGGISTERDLTHEMQLMVMRSIAIACWRGLVKGVVTEAHPNVIRC
jgi:hypothetical protein